MSQESPIPTIVQCPACMRYVLQFEFGTADVPFVIFWDPGRYQRRIMRSSIPWKDLEQVGIGFGDGVEHKCADFGKASKAWKHYASGPFGGDCEGEPKGGEN